MTGLPSFYYTTAAAFGIVAHAAYFNRGEHYLNGAFYVALTLLTCSSGTGLFVRAGEKSLSDALLSVIGLAASFFTGLYTSLLIYRVLLHPLRQFSGPFWARVSNLWWSSQISNGDAYQQIGKLHKKYGDFVRIGSSDLSIAHPEAPQAIYGANSKCGKSFMYDTNKPMESMHNTRDRKVHDQRRRLWSDAFGDKALRGYETRIRGYGDRLKARIENGAGKPTNIAQWFRYYAFDVIGDLALGESFEMLEKGDTHWAIKTIRDNLDILTMQLPAWVTRLMMTIPFISRPFWGAMAFCDQQLDKRMQKKVVVPDIMSTLLEPFRDGHKPTSEEINVLRGDVQLLVLAGSETTSTALTTVFYYLAQERARVEQLRAELLPFVTQAGDVSHRDIQDAPYLNGCIYEALRMFPPLPTRVPRITPSEGIQIGDKWIPGNTCVWSPQYVIGKNPNVFEDPEIFLPERWAPFPESLDQITAFAPFSFGPMNCIGRPLALMELRTVLAKLITAFDVEFAPGEKGTRFFDRARDHYTMETGPLELVFTPSREGANLAGTENWN